ncbi:uncharacterized protein LOC127722144 isoform X4 [Mytilus californianus]|uniref:uncharacterized protein LOC127722144 isoform X4 n=1 Tax=Mytilus californianus TaxID=6549 RepID=UPI00224820E8|nr:uncharacterized protein LOC127722144 isoform X4 [Mytilus californianus]
MISTSINIRTLGTFLSAAKYFLLNRGLEYNKMAEIVTEISDIIDESADGMAEEAEGAEEDMEPEEQAEFEEEVADAKEAVQELSKTAEVFTNIMEGSLKMAIEKTYATAKHLKTKKDGKSSFNIPTVANIDSLLDGLVSFHKSLRTLRDFAEQNKGKVVGLKSFLEIVTPEVLDEIQNQIENVKKMPTE